MGIGGNTAGSQRMRSLGRDPSAGDEVREDLLKADGVHGPEWPQRFGQRLHGAWLVTEQLQRLPVPALEPVLSEGPLEAVIDEPVNAFEPVANWLHNDNYMSDIMDLSRIERAMVTLRRRQTRRALARLTGHAHSPTFDVLDALEAAEHANQPATVATLAEELHVDQPRASRLAAAAVATGLARREADQTDGRRTRLVRTRRGIAATERVHAFRRGMFAAAMADWSTEERATFARLLTRFVDALPGDPARS